mgnify:CR=1 FL=1
MFKDRTDAGERLGDLVAQQVSGDEGIVLGLPRGGVPVAAGVASATGMELDALVVRKIGVPWYPELAMGAVAAGHVVVNRDVIDEVGVTESQFDEVLGREQQELERRERRYRPDRLPLDLKHRAVVIVDDGIATGATVRAAVAAVRSHEPNRIIVATPVASVQAVVMLEHLADDVIVASSPDPFGAVGSWYADFRQTTDNEVRACLQS